MRNWRKGKAFILVLFIVAFFQACGGDSAGGQSEINAPYAPQESPRKTANFRYSTSPQGFSAVMGWMQAIDIYGSGEEMMVEVDWMRLYAVLEDGTEKLLLEDNFYDELPMYDCYGLYLRDPWFGEDDYHDPMLYLVEDSKLIITPGSDPDFVFHWWTERVEVPEEATLIWFEARIRVTGAAGVQAGIDYWKDLHAGWAGFDVNNTEAGASDWFGNVTSDWQIISVGRP